ncbi:MAG: nuclear transport factor 2 family protein [Melioribacteraceae bacterium]|nr:nuclear transport factor 2 family protein [Melioribacteraceae bacterium]
MKTELTMNMKERREQLNEIYQKLLEVGFGDGSLDESLKYIDENVMGYGTALDEKIMSYNDFRDLIIVQRNQAANFDDFIYQSNPVINRLFNEGNSALIVDEIDLTSVINGENKMMTVRMSTMLEFNKETWKVVHWHGSIADHVSDGEDPWHVEEWKQKTEKLERMVEEKTAELIQKNRELEIEAALEQVRSIAMGMRKSDDLLNICEVSYNEFEKLGFDNLRAVLIHILDDEKRTFADYDYCDLFGGEISTLSYDSHPVVVNYFNQIRSSKDAFAEAVFTGEELESWKKVRLETGQKNDPRLNNANALYYYGYSIGIGDFTISTLKPIDEYKRKILKRFRNVFDLAYRRFTDITKAEEQAREAKIEAALERVRGSALAMHSSEDLAITIDHFFHELKNLNIQLIRCGVGIKNKDSRIVDVTVTSATESGEDIKLTGKLKLSGHPILDKVYEALQLQAEYFPVLHGDEINEYYRTMNPDIEFPNFSEDDVQYGYYFNFQEGGVFVWTEKELFEKEINIFRRFKSVLSLTYRRYMDLKEAEAQAREAQIELSLERVRARTMAMQKSDELSNTASLMFKEIVELGVNLWSCGFNIIDHEKKLITQWVSSGDGRILPPFETPATDDIFMRFYEGSKLGESLYIEEMGGQQLVDHYKYMTSLPQVLDIVSELDNAGIELPKFQIMHAAYFKQGYLLFITYKAVPDFHSIFERFAKVFEQTYTRFLDLQKAEAQTREAQIEAALERVRSRSMAMHKSDELADLSLELVKQVHALGVDTWFCAFNIYDDDQQGSLEWGSNGQGTFPQYRTPREGIFLRYYEAGQRGEKLFVNEINEKECPPHYEYLCSLPGVGEQLLKMKGAGIPFPTSQIDHVAYFKYGYIIFITFEPALEAHDIFKRFAGVFEQTYTRFLDLQKSEEQRKIIQAENRSKDRRT